MRKVFLAMVAVSAWALVATPAHAIISHGYSNFFSIQSPSHVDHFGDLPLAPELALAYPNPFNPRTVLQFFLPRSADVELAIFDVRGRAVRHLSQQTYPAGWSAEAWDGRDDGGKVLPGGTYFCRFRSLQETRTRKLILAK